MTCTIHHARPPGQAFTVGSFVSLCAGTLLFDNDSRLITAFHRKHIIAPCLMVRSADYATEHRIESLDHGVLRYGGWIYRFYNSEQRSIEQALFASPDALDYTVEHVQLSLDRLKSRQI